MAKLVVVDKEKGSSFDVELNKDNTTLGRAVDNDVIVEHEKASRHHCHVEKIGPDYKLVDDASANGTTVNGQGINTHMLKDGDLIEIGTIKLTFIKTADAKKALGGADGARRVPSVMRKRSSGMQMAILGAAGLVLAVMIGVIGLKMMNPAEDNLYRECKALFERAKSPSPGEESAALGDLEKILAKIPETYEHDAARMHFGELRRSAKEEMQRIRDRMEARERNETGARNELEYLECLKLWDDANGLPSEKEREVLLERLTALKTRIKYRVDLRQKTERFIAQCKKKELTPEENEDFLFERFVDGIRTFIDEKEYKKALIELAGARNRFEKNKHLVRITELEEEIEGLMKAQGKVAGVDMQLDNKFGSALIGMDSLKRDTRRKLYKEMLDRKLKPGDGLKAKMLLWRDEHVDKLRSLGIYSQINKVLARHSELLSVRKSFMSLVNDASKYYKERSRTIGRKELDGYLKEISAIWKTKPVTITDEKNEFANQLAVVEELDEYVTGLKIGEPLTISPQIYRGMLGEPASPATLNLSPEERKTAERNESIRLANRQAFSIVWNHPNEKKTIDEINEYREMLGLVILEYDPDFMGGAKSLYERVLQDNTPPTDEMAVSVFKTSGVSYTGKLKCIFDSRASDPSGTLKHMAENPDFHRAIVIENGKKIGVYRLEKYFFAVIGAE